MKLKTFDRPGGQALANYDWVDISEGSGKVLFYGCRDAISGSITYSLLTNEVYSYTADINTTSSTTFDFYTPAFNLPKVIAGTAYANYCTQADNGGSCFATIQLKLYRDGSDVSNITSQLAGVPITSAAMNLIKMPCTQTNIKKGDQVHMVFILTKVAPANNAWVGVDPQNRDGTSIQPSSMTSATTRFKLWIPFRIAL